MANREDNIYKAKLSKQMKRYEDMVKFMKLVIMIDSKLTLNEMKLLFNAYKQIVCVKHKSWKMIKSIEQNERLEGTERTHFQIIKKYRIQVQNEIIDVCRDILDIIDKHLIPNAFNVKAKAIYHKFKGDYYKCLAEYESNNERKNAMDNCLASYKLSNQIVMTELQLNENLEDYQMMHLGLVLNLTIFSIQLIDTQERVFTIAKVAFDEIKKRTNASNEETDEAITSVDQFNGHKSTLSSDDLENNEMGEN